jgi:hypothetical protein
MYSCILTIDLLLLTVKYFQFCRNSSNEMNPRTRVDLIQKRLTYTKYIYIECIFVISIARVLWAR